MLISSLYLGPRYGQEEPTEVFFTRYHVLVHSGSQVRERAYRFGRGRRPRGIHCCNIRIRPSHKARQLEDEHTTEDQEGYPRRARLDLVFRMFVLRECIRCSEPGLYTTHAASLSYSNLDCVEHLVWCCPDIVATRSDALMAFHVRAAAAREQI